MYLIRLESQKQFLIVLKEMKNEHEKFHIPMDQKDFESKYSTKVGSLFS